MLPAYFFHEIKMQRANFSAHKKVIHEMGETLQQTTKTNSRKYIADIFPAISQTSFQMFASFSRENLLISKKILPPLTDESISSYLPTHFIDVGFSFTTGHYTIHKHYILKEI